MEQNHVTEKILSDTGLALFIMAGYFGISSNISNYHKISDPEIFNKDWYGWVMTALCVGNGSTSILSAIGSTSRIKEINISVIQFIGILCM